MMRSSAKIHVRLVSFVHAEQLELITMWCCFVLAVSSKKQETCAVIYIAEKDKCHGLRSGYFVSVLVDSASALDY
jgi:hypothetical protein